MQENVLQSYSLQLIKSLPADQILPSVKADITLAGDRLRVDYQVRNAKLNAQARFPKDQPVWNLWDLDVCEIFISSSQDQSLVATSPYFEFQVSPFGQFFELKVLEPRKSADQSFRSGLTCGGDVKTTQAWNAWIEIPLSALGLSGQLPVFGGVFACLLRPPHRAYMASHLPVQDKPDFHLPAQFVRLV